MTEVPPTIPDPLGVGGSDLSGLVTIIFVIVIGGIVFSLLKAAMKYADNSAQKPVLRPARIVAKRQESRVSGGGVNDMPVSSTTTHFITFEFADGTREELEVKGDVYGLLAEGDSGTLKSQGTWFQGFERAAALASTPAPQ